MAAPSDSTATLFGQMPVAEFLRDYWQKKPCLFRQALPGFKSPLDIDEVAGLALEDEIESRLIIEQPRGKGRPSDWSLQNGPFSEQTLTDLPDTHWSLLVQAVDQWVPEVHDLLQHFTFLPRWRLDDIMISVAPPGGSVGPHFDQYDVFLLQAEGQRRWQVGGPCHADTELQDGTPLKILADLTVAQDWVLEPGDILYLPPVLAHHGVAETTSQTWSIGFRAPDAVEALHGIALRGDLEADADFLRYTDHDLTADESTQPGIAPQAVARVQALLQTLTERDEVVADWLGAFMTQSKYDAFDWAEAEAGAEQETAVLDPLTALSKALPTRITAYQQRLYVNGRAFPLTHEDQPLINTLVNDNRWTWGELSALANSVQAKDTLTVLVLSDSLAIDED